MRLSMMRTVVVFLVIGTFSVSKPVVAGEKYFTLRQAVEFSLQNNGELQALREEKGIREAGRIRAGLFTNPVFEMDGTTGELTGSRFENTLSVGVSQEFLTMGKRRKRLTVAEKETEGFEQRIANSDRFVVEEVKTTFYDLLLAQKKIELAERSVALGNQLLAITRERLEAGDIPELEVNLTRVEVARSEGRKVEAERELHPARARLLAIMGLPPAETAMFSGSLDGAPITMGLEDLKQLALSKRADLKALEAEKEKGEAEIALAQAERVPNLTLGIGYQRANSAIEVGGEEVKTRDNLITMKLSIPIPLFDRNQAGIREANARKESAESRRLFQRRVVEREVEAAYSRLTTGEKALAIYSKDIIPLLEENLKLVQEAYRVGEVGILNVIEEQKKFVEVSEAYLTFLHARQTALVKLEAAIGVDLQSELSGGVR